MKRKALYLYLLLFFLLCCSVTANGQEKKQERFTLMGLGDLILSVPVRANAGSGRLIIVVSAARMWSF